MTPLYAVDEDGIGYGEVDGESAQELYSKAGVAPGRSQVAFHCAPFPQSGVTKTPQTASKGGMIFHRVFQRRLDAQEARADGGPFVGTIDMTTGVITPIVKGLNGPGGLVFVDTTSREEEWREDGGDTCQDHGEHPHRH